jgi:hypothetical protein
MFIMLYNALQCLIMPPQLVLLHDVAWTNGMIEFQPGNVGRPPAYHVEVLTYYEYSRGPLSAEYSGTRQVGGGGLRRVLT